MASPSPQYNDNGKGKGKEKKKYLLESETKAENSTPEKTTTKAAGSSVQRARPNPQLTRVFTNPIMGTMGNMSCL